MGGGGKGGFLGRYHSNMLSLAKQGSFRVRPHSQSKSFHGRPNSRTMLYGAPEVPRQEREPIQRVIHRRCLFIVELNKLSALYTSKREVMYNTHFCIQLVRLPF